MCSDCIEKPLEVDLFQLSWKNVSIFKLFVCLPVLVKQYFKIESVQYTSYETSDCSMASVAAMSVNF